MVKTDVVLFNKTQQKTKNKNKSKNKTDKKKPFLKQTKLHLYKLQTHFFDKVKGQA